MRMRLQAPHFPRSEWGRLGAIFTSQLPELARAQARAREQARARAIARGEPDPGPDPAPGAAPRAWGPLEEAVFARFAAQAAKHRERVRVRARGAWARANALLPPGERAPAPPGRGLPGRRRGPRPPRLAREELLLAAGFAPAVWPRLDGVPTQRLEAAARACARARLAAGRAAPEGWGAEEEGVCARFAASAKRARLNDRARQALKRARPAAA
jgi:hypothetical protein